MPLELGNTSTFVYGNIANEGRVLSSFTIVNKTTNSVNANLAIRRGNGSYNIIPKDTPIYGNQMYPTGVFNPIQLNANDKVYLAVTGEVDYTFSYEKPNS